MYRLISFSPKGISSIVVQTLDPQYEGARAMRDGRLPFGLLRIKPCQGQ